MAKPGYAGIIDITNVNSVIISNNKYTEDVIKLKDSTSKDSD